MTAPGTRLVRVPGASLHVDQSGDRPATIFVHGFGGDLHTWDALWPLIPGDRLRYDLRGFGRSVADHAEPFGHGDDLLALLDTLGQDRCDLVGVSMGGAAALALALDHPALVGRLILISPGLAGWRWSAEWRAAWQSIRAEALAGQMAEARMLWWRHPLFATTRAGPAAAALHASILAYSGAQWIADDQRPSPPDMGRLGALAPPTLLLAGTHDMADFRGIADHIVATAPDVMRVDIPGCGHMLHLEDPAGCAAHIAAFRQARSL